MLGAGGWGVKEGGDGVRRVVEEGVMEGAGVPGVAEEEMPGCRGWWVEGGVQAVLRCRGWCGGGGAGAEERVAVGEGVGREYVCGCKGAEERRGC